MKKLFTLLILIGSAYAQNPVYGTITGTGCVTIDVNNRGVVGISVTNSSSGSAWSGTIQPEVAIGGDPAQNAQVTPFSSSTAQNNITANGDYQAYITGANTFLLCGNTVTNTAQVKLTASPLAARLSGGGGGGGSGTVTSVTAGTGLSGGTITSSGTISLSTPVTVSNGGTGVTSAQGNGSKVQLSSGSTTTNDCVKFDANGNTVDAGATCGTGGGGFTPQTNGTNNASLAGLNFITSITNAAGLTLTPSNPSTTTEQMEITGTYSGSGASISSNTIPLASIVNSTANTLFGFNNSGVGSDVTVGTGLTLSGGVLASSGGFSATANQAVNGTGSSAQAGFAPGTTSGTSGHAACPTSTSTIGNCTALPPVNPIGAFNASGTFINSGLLTITIDATQNVTVGDVICYSSSTAGLFHDNGSMSCPLGLGAGIVFTTASSTSTPSVFLALR